MWPRQSASNRSPFSASRGIFHQSSRRLSPRLPWVLFHDWHCSLLTLGVLLVEVAKRVGPLLNRPRCLVEMIAGDGEESARFVHLEVARTAPAIWKLAFEDDVNARTRWRNLCVGIEPGDDALRPLIDDAATGIAAVVYVDADDGIVVCEDEADAYRGRFVDRLECRLEAPPGARIGRRRILARRRFDRHLRRLGARWTSHIPLPSLGPCQRWRPTRGHPSCTRGSRLTPVQ